MVKTRLCKTMSAIRSYLVYAYNALISAQKSAHKDLGRMAKTGPLTKANMPVSIASVRAYFRRFQIILNDSQSWPYATDYGWGYCI